MTDVADDAEFTELVDAHVPRVDLVAQPANGSAGFLLMKQDGRAGLLDADTVRDLIAKAQPTPPTEETVTMTGSPAAIARLIHGAPLRPAVKAPQPTYEQLVKAKYNAEDLRRMAANGQAMDDESYPIGDREDLDRAIRAVGRGGADHDAIRRHIIARAKTLGASSEIPDNWNADGSLKKGSVEKETAMADDTALDVTEVLAEPDGGTPGMPTDPGSPAWEAIDAATARKWTAILARARTAIDVLADRELLEAAAGNDEDAEQAWDLQDACCAIDYAISVLAPFAVAEQAEADCAEQMAAVGKALHGWDPAALDTIEALTQVRKAGRVLSAANEAAIRGAVESLQKVLASLPAAPLEKNSGGQPVADEKETEMPTPTTSAETVAEAGEAPQMGVAKADGEKTPMVVVYDQKGRLIGIVDPSDVTPVANSEAEPEPDGDEGDGKDGADGAATETPDLEPAPSGEVGTPADAVPDGVAKTTDDTARVLKSIAQDVVTASLDAHRAAQEQVIAKQAQDLAQLADTIEVLKGRITALEEQPAAPRVFANGAVPPAHQLRGQNQGAAPIDTAAAQQMRKGLYSPDAQEQNRTARQMQQQAIDRLSEMHRRGPQ